MTLGKLSDMDLDAARQKASDLRKLIAQGINPLSETVSENC